MPPVTQDYEKKAVYYNVWLPGGGVVRKTTFLFPGPNHKVKWSWKHCKTIANQIPALGDLKALRLGIPKIIKQ